MPVTHWCCADLSSCEPHLALHEFFYNRNRSAPGWRGAGMVWHFLLFKSCLSSAAASPPAHAAPVHSKPASALSCDSSALSNARLVPRLKGHTRSWAQTNHYPLILSPRGSLRSGSPPALLHRGGKQCGQQALRLWVQTASTGTFALLPRPDWSLQASGSSMVKQSGSTHLLGESRTYVLRTAPGPQQALT